ncbi:MAG: glycosyltransferase, partial [Candidatus Omnitrophica bacterium]|nr:glycosyltransferase [Candidatus Omnitrophota bacterium]
MTDTPIDIFIICFKRTSSLDACCASIEKHTNTIRYRLRIVEGERSAAENRNRALAQATSGWFVIMDDDVVVTPGWLDTILAHRNEAIGQIQPKLLFPDNRIFSAEKMFINPWGDNVVVGRGQNDNGRFDYIKIVELLSGTCCLYNKKILDTCFFDTRYVGTQWEDCDFSLQIRRSGFDLLYCGASAVYHHNLYRNPSTENFLYFKEKWFSHRSISRRGVLRIASARDKAGKLKSQCNKVKFFYGNSGVDISGPAALTYPDIDELVGYCKGIDLKPTIVTQGQGFSVELLEKLKSAGVEDFSVSYCEQENVCIGSTAGKNEHTVMRQAIQSLSKVNIPFRVTVAVAPANYQAIPALARELAAAHPHAVTFSMHNVPKKKVAVPDRTFALRYTTAAPYIIDAISMLDSNSIAARIRHVPFCLFSGFEKHIINYAQLPFDTWAEGISCGYVLHGEADYLYYHLGSRSRYAYAPSCRQCSLRLICDGAEKKYLKQFGFGELKPRGGMLVRDPLYFNTLKYNPAIEDSYYTKKSLINNIEDFLSEHPDL